MKLILAMILSLLVASYAPSALAQDSKSQAKQSTGKIKGLILDPNDARISFATITIASSPKVGFKKELKASAAGDFEAELPAGVYYLTVEAKHFCKFEGWELKVSSEATEMINIHMEVASSHGPGYCTLKKS